jgi:hypothetical protein
MATTTNYGWTTPDNTALVKDGASAIRTLGSSIDTTLKAQIDAQIPDTLLTTTGDTIYASAANTPARLGVGTTGQVLTVAAGLPTWATPAGGGTDFILLNSGGTALTGANTITVSGISNQDKLWIYITGQSGTAINGELRIRINGDTGSNYIQQGYYSSRPAGSANWENINATQAFFTLGFTYAVASNGNGSMIIQGGKSTGGKVISSVSASNDSSDGRTYTTQGIWNNSASITSISAVISTGNFDAGTMFIYGSSN